MSEFAKEITNITVEQELKQSYLDYAMSVIVGRALPDVRDGLKPVHRRALYAMNELSNLWNKPYKKSARIVGDVIGKYHPHGDTAVYDTIVRMAQPFSMRYMLVDGQGNFGSVDGDSPAAMRYTEIRMAKITQYLLADLDKETVDFAPNYDGSEMAPTVMPTRIPALLVNGSSGIAVGMATNIPPHNLTEVLNACMAVIDDANISFDELMDYLPGPDFPTSGMINGRAGIVEAYKTGRGRIKIRAKAHIESSATGKESIIVDELPYQVNKARLLEKMGELVRDKKIEGITALRDESDKDGMRMVIEVRKGDHAEVLLNNLYAQTQMQVVFGINMVALDQGQPKIMNLKSILEAFVAHRRDVVTRRTIFELRKARERAHLLEGLSVALANIDDMIALIKSAPTPAEAKVKLLEKIWQPGAVKDLLARAGSDASRPVTLSKEFGLGETGYRLSEAQAQAILEMRLHRLTGLEQDKIFDEYKALLAVIEDLLDILQNPDRLMRVIRAELVEIKEQFGDDRRTEIIANQLDLTDEDLIADEAVVVTLSQSGYAKTQLLDTYQAQHRGGKGKIATTMKDEDLVEHLIIANTLDYLLCFTSRGKVYWLKAYQLPQGSRIAKGQPIVNLLPLEKGEAVTTMLPIREFPDDQYIFMATAKGTVKKVALSAFSRPRSNGIIAINLREDDRLIGVDLTHGEQDIMLFSDAGKVIRFHEADVRAIGRTGAGVRGIRLEDEQAVTDLIVAPDTGAILTVTEKGYGKRTAIDDYPVRGRGGKGVISIHVNERNGAVIGAVKIINNEDVMLISDKGTLVRTPANEVSVIGRNTQGVTLIKLAKKEQLVGLQRIEVIGGEDDQVVCEDDVAQDE